MDYHGLVRRIRAASFRLATLAAVLAALAFGRTASASQPGSITVEPRIVEARVARASLEQLDLEIRVALRASHAATIRSIAFTDAFVGRVPVWMAPIDGHWPLSPGQELLIPRAVLVRVQARDALGADDFAAMVRKGSVPVRASVEVGVATPWLGRLFFQPRTQIVVREMSVDLPIQMPAGYLAPLARIGADIADVAQRGAAAWLASGLNRLPGRRTLVERFGGAVAGVTTRYAIEAGGTSTRRERRAAGVWWSPGVFCTTREALEPWRFDVGDATSLQIGAGRLRHDQAVVAIAPTGAHAGATIDADALASVLPAGDDRKVYTLVDGRRRRLRLGDRAAASNLACLRIAATEAPGAVPALPAAAPAPGSELAAFAPGTTAGLVWTRLDTADGTRLRLATPLHRTSFGSPLVAGDRLAGLVSSPTAAWTAAVVDAAAARAPHVAAGHAGR
jgi:hypothetical protein